MSDLAVVLIPVLAGVVGAVAAVPWVRRSKESRRFVGGLDVCERIEKIMRA